MVVYDGKVRNPDARRKAMLYQTFVTAVEHSVLPPWAKSRLLMPHIRKALGVDDFAALLMLLKEAHDQRETE